MISEKLSHAVRNRVCEDRWLDLHDDQHRTDDHTLHATSKDGVRNDGQGFVDDHVGDEESDEEEVAVLSNGLDLPRVLLLLPVV